MTAVLGAALDVTPMPAGAPAAAAPTVLLVDDSAVQRRIVHALLDAVGTWNVVTAADGLAALRLIEEVAPVLVLSDAYMPKLDGLGLVQQVRERFPHVPVVLMTGHGSEQVAADALKAGAADYIPKRSMAADLGRTVERVLANARAASDRARVLSGVTGRTTRFVLDNDPRLVGPLVAQLRDDLLAVGVCDRHAATRVGIALEEAVANAIYHGNLEVSTDLRQNGDDAFYRLAAERRGQRPYADRRVRVVARVTPAKATFAVADDGPGFDPAALPDPTDPANLERPGGRGLLLIRSFMDDVRHNPAGNRITMVKKRSA